MMLLCYGSDPAIMKYSNTSLICYKYVGEHKLNSLAFRLQLINLLDVQRRESTAGTMNH